PSYALKGFLSAKVLDYVLNQIYANDDTKVEKSSSASIVYGTNTLGNQQNYPLAETPLANGQVPMASAGGRIQSGANTQGASQPTDYNHLTRKDYVDTADSALVFGIVDGD
ncbi:MAG: hypothetical protein IIZ94_04225, partial [Prevotella sp.]|nr:hypothetical protein [Prevotella sp.]